MAQQPNVEITDAERPRTRLGPAPAVGWRADKPGIPDGPDDVPRGGVFDTTGPDQGWGLRILRLAELPDDDPRLAEVVEGLALLRSATLGRGPVMDDIDAALAVCGYGFDAAPEVLERRARWLEAVPHETRSGETAAAEVDRDLLVRTPAEIADTLRRR
ncbi:MAG TPA: hypothetical protein VJ948_05040 [Acidimicrobiia bacterium]|nr:hypothetical protein [Acidimicrobiia bacterium]